MPAITVRGIEINYLESGEGLHNAVFLHGNLQSATLWDGFIAGMPEEFHCLAFDFRGFGGSPATPPLSRWEVSAGVPWGIGGAMSSALSSQPAGTSGGVSSTTRSHGTVGKISAKAAGLSKMPV